MTFKVKTLSKDRIACVWRVGSYGSANIEVLEKLKNGLKRKILLDRQSYLHFHNNPEATLPENRRFKSLIIKAAIFYHRANCGRSFSSSFIESIPHHLINCLRNCFGVIPSNSLNFVEKCALSLYPTSIPVAVIE